MRTIQLMSRSWHCSCSCSCLCSRGFAAGSNATEALSGDLGPSADDTKEDFLEPVLADLGLLLLLFVFLFRNAGFVALPLGMANKGTVFLRLFEVASRLDPRITADDGR